MKTFYIFSLVMMLCVFGTAQSHQFCPTDASCTYTGAQTQTLQNGTYFPDNAAGADAGAKIQTKLASIGTYPRGLIDAKGLFGNQTCSNFTLLPGHTVWMPSGTCSVTASSVIREDAELKGLTGHLNGASGGTVLKADPTLVGPMMTFQTTNPGDWLANTRLENLNFDGNKAAATSSTYCVQALNPFGEASWLHNLYLNNCKTAGIRTEAGFQLNLTLDNVSSFASVNGFDFDQAGGFINARMISGDDNSNALVRFNSDATGNLSVTAFKAESKGVGLQPTVFDFSTSWAAGHTGMLSARGGHVSCSNGGTVSDIVTVTGTHEIGGVHLSDVWANSGCVTNILNDTVNSVVVPLNIFTNNVTDANQITDFYYYPGRPSWVVAAGDPVLFNGVKLRSRVAAGGSTFFPLISGDGNNRTVLGDTSGVVLAGPIVTSQATQKIKNGADADLGVIVDSGATTAKNSYVGFSDQGTLKWSWQKPSSNSMTLFNHALSTSALVFSIADNSATFSNKVTANGGLALGSTTVGALPSAASNSFLQMGVTDSTAITAEGQTCVGGGAVKAIAISNGTVWKCF